MMPPSRAFLLLFSLLSMVTYNYAQTENYYTIKGNAVEKKKFHHIEHVLKFESEEAPSEEAMTIGWGGLAAKLIPLLVDGASKLFYNPDNFNKEYFASYSFFDASSGFRKLDPSDALVFEHNAQDETGEQERINRFKFELGAVKNVEGYHYIGLKSYDLHYSWSKLSAANNRMNYIIDLEFYYFDEDDKAQEFHINPILLDSRIIIKSQGFIDDVNYQVLPKMKVLQTIQIRVREVNAKKQNWDRYLELYQSNQDNISRFLIRAITK